MVGRVVNNLIEVRQGDSFDIVLHVITDKGENMDLDGSTFKMQVRNDNDAVVFEKKGDVTPSDALVRFALTPSETDKDVGDYVTDIQWTDKYGRVNTIFPQDINKVGVFRITRQVTK